MSSSPKGAALKEELACTTITRIPFIEVLSVSGREVLGLSLDADEIARRALFESVQGFVYRDTKEKADSKLREVAAILRSAVIRHGARSLAMLDLFHELHARLVDRDVKVILLKGAALGEYVYAEQGYRQIGDVDFLVPSNMVQTVCQEMRGLGMAPDDISDAQYSLTHQHNISWYKNHPKEIECHWRIVPPHGPFPIETDKLWKEAVEVEYRGLPILILSPEHFLIHICVHMHFHGYNRGLLDMLDVYALTTHNRNLDWDKLAVQAKAWNADGILYAVLNKMMDLIGVDGNVKSHIAALHPQRYWQRKVIVPMVRQKLSDRSPGFMRKSTSKVGSSRASDIESMALALGAGCMKAFVQWVLPSRERISVFYNLSESDWSCKYYLRYYIDLLGRLACAAKNLLMSKGR